MGYYLGVDLGTTYTAAAVYREGSVRAVTLGNRTSVLPSVVYLREDDSVIVGEAANRRAMSDPERVAREFKRRVGDPTPVMLGGSPYAAEMLMAKMFGWVVDHVTQREGGPPSALAMTHPANWGAFKTDLLDQAIRHAELDAICPVTKLAEPVAAAMSYASNERVEAGEIIAVYDLGGGTFDAVVLRKDPDTFSMVGSPEGIERLGGIDFDQAVFQHVVRSLDLDLATLDDDQLTMGAIARLRTECCDAKEALSGDTDVSITVMLPKLQTEVRLTRSEFEALIRAPLNETVEVLKRTVRGAHLELDQISRILLVGGSSRIPLVAELVASATNRPIAIDANPKDAIAFGAALAAAQLGGESDVVDTTTMAVNPEVDEKSTPSFKTLPAAAAAAGGFAAGVAAAAAAAPTPPPDLTAAAAPTPPPDLTAAPPAGSGQPVGQYRVSAPPPQPPTQATQPVSGQTPLTPGYDTAGYDTAGYDTGSYGAPPPAKKSAKVGVIAAVVVIALIGGLVVLWALTRSGDEPASPTLEAADDTTTTDEETTTTDEETTTTDEETTTTTEEEDPFAGYTSSIESGYMDSCMAENPGNTDADQESYCQCTYDKVSTQIPFDDFVELSSSADPTSLPPELQTIVDECNQQVFG